MAPRKCPWRKLRAFSLCYAFGMFWNKYLLPSLVTLLFLATLHVLFIHFYVYWRLRWVDIPVHIIGGMWIVLALSWLLEWLIPSVSISFSRAIMWGLIVGGLWEISELMIGIVSAPSHGYIADTVKDLCDDVIGAVIGYFVVLWIQVKEKI